MTSILRAGLALAGLAGLCHSTASAQPPFSGTIFIAPDVITSADPTTFTGATYTGQGTRVMFDRRVNAFISLNAYLFDATFSNGQHAEIQVNPEFGSATAAALQATRYGTEIGRLPAVLRTDVQTVWIHQGVQPFGGGNHNLLIHTGQADLYAAQGILEETFVHEAAHTSLDAAHANAPGWLAAQLADPNFISTYARDNPTTEDIAESFLPWLAVRHRADRISPALLNTISTTMPNRMAYFDSQRFNVFPVPEPTGALLAMGAATGVGVLLRRYRRGPESKNTGPAAQCGLPGRRTPSTTLAAQLLLLDTETAACATQRCPRVVGRCGATGPWD